MKRMFSLLLTAALLLASLPGCQWIDQLQIQLELPESQLAASEVVSALMLASGYTGRVENLEYMNAGGHEDERLTAYLELAYGLSDGAWEDAAIIRATGASAFELAVLRLENQDEAARAVVLLTSYISNRRGDFAGYAPEQADMVSDGEIAQNGLYTALCICPDSDRAAAAFFAAFSGEVQAEPGLPSILPSAPLPPDQPAQSDLPTQEPPEPSEPPEASEPPETPKIPEMPSTPAIPETPATQYIARYPGRYDYIQPNKDDMSVYDTSAILTAWRTGDPAALSGYDKNIYYAAQNVLNTVLSDDMSDLEKETAVYYWIVNNVDYDWTHQDVMSVTPRESFTPYGGLVNRTAVCLGYATTFQLLMDLAGVECITVVGAAGAADNSMEDHGWNMVRLNGNWYCVDVTWDANYREYGSTSGREREWVYFNITSDRMALTDHQWDYAHVPEAVTRGNGRG